MSAGNLNVLLEVSEPNFKNRTVWTRDNLDVLRGMNSGCVDLIYLDPPFNSNRSYAAPIGSDAAGAAFKDTWSRDDVDDAEHGMLAESDPALYQVIRAALHAHGDGMFSYLLMMASRLLEMKRILKPSGSIYLHCDPTASHYLKLVMDCIFGKKAFRNEIVWCYTGPGSPKMRQFNRKHDTLLWYSVGKVWTFNRDDVRLPYKDPKQKPRRAFDTGGAFDTEAIAALRKRGKIPEDWWPQAPGNGLCIVARSPKERTGYPTQKPLALLERIIKASSNEGDMILDPFCGCATTLVAAESLNREWVGIDLSPLAVKLVSHRLRDQHGAFGQIIKRTDDLERTDLEKPPPPREHKVKLYGRQHGDCNGCGEHFPYHGLTIDHVVPRSKGGTDHAKNLQLLCGYCNSKKGSRSQAWLLAQLRKEGMIS